MGCQAHKAASPGPRNAEAESASKNPTLLTSRLRHSKATDDELKSSTWSAKKRDRGAETNEGPSELDELAGEPEQSVAEEEYAQMPDRLRQYPRRHPSPSFDEASPPTIGTRRQTERSFASTSLGCQSAANSVTSPVPTPTTTASSASHTTRQNKVVVGIIQRPDADHHALDGSEAKERMEAIMATPRPSAAVQATPRTPRAEAQTRLWLIAPQKPELEGEYRPVRGWLANGEFLWHKADGDCWVYSSADAAGRWMVTRGYGNIELDKALIRTMYPHYSNLPPACLQWMYGDDAGQFTQDADKHVRFTQNREDAEQTLELQKQEASLQAERERCWSEDAPQTLWIAAPPKPFLQGEYRRQEPCMHNGMAVWKQVDGNGWLFNSRAKSHWLICSHPPGACKETVEIMTAAPHQKRWPQECHSWKYTSATKKLVSDVIGTIRVWDNEDAAMVVLANYDPRYTGSEYAAQSTNL